MVAIDNFSTNAISPTHPCGSAAVITPHDTNELTNVTRAIYVGTTGNIRLTTNGGDDITFSNIPAGTIMPLRVKLVHTDTTASDLVAIW